MTRFNIVVMATCESTNAELMARAKAGAESGAVIVSEHQTAGRGRRGRSWFSAPGDSLTFSLLWRFPSGKVVDGLSLAVGVSIAETLMRLGATGIALKWPNDVLRSGRKLAGILVERVPGAADNPAVIGIGINLRLPAELPDDVRAGAAALDLPVSRGELLDQLLANLHKNLNAFTADGFACIQPRWQALNAHAGLSVQVVSDFAPPLAGRCLGIDDDGALLLETTDDIRRIITGDVSMRPT
ncbi:MAG: biotin--[acetyl-CoA-carboxylase] ligase [Rhodocyclaceae bacterium]|nr:biotin--[acetyl-CoA-carboxylase] ligase [Rhodocyclaceae bacterium]